MSAINFPNPAAQTPLNTFSPTSTPETSTNGVTYIWSDGSWSIYASASGGGGGGGIEEAPINGKQYGREDGGWTEITVSGGGFSGDYDDLTNKPDIPENTSDLVNDSGFITAGDVPNGFSGDYDDLTNKPDIPENTSDLVNDSGFITAADIPDPPSGDYLRIDSGAGDQTVESTGTTTFDGLVAAGGGVKVTGGSAADVGPGLYKGGAGGVDIADENGNRVASFAGSGRIGFPGTTGAAGVYISNTPGTSSNLSYGIWLDCDWSGATGTKASGIYSVGYSGAAINNYSSFESGGTGLSSRFTGDDSVQAGFAARNTLSSAAKTNAGFLSNVGAAADAGAIADSRVNYGFLLQQATHQTTSEATPTSVAPIQITLVNYGNLH